MRKTKGILSQLNLDQQAAVERWLFDDTPALTYAEAQARIQTEFAVQVSLCPIYQFYQRRAKDRMLEKIVTTGHAGNSVWGEFGKRPAQPFETLMEMLGRTAFDIPATASGELSLGEIKDLAGVAAVGIRANAEITHLRIRAREVEVKSRDVALREKKYQDHLALIAKTGGHAVERGLLTEEALEEMVTAANFL